MVTVQVDPEELGTARGTGTAMTGRVMTVIGTIVVTVVGTEVTVVGGGTTVVVVETVTEGTVVGSGETKAHKTGKNWHSSFRIRATSA